MSENSQKSPRDDKRRGGAADDSSQPVPTRAQPGSLSEIGHLFLSGLRDRQTNSAEPPRRRPPGQRDETSPMGPAAADFVDLSADELAQVAAGESTSGRPPICALIGAHLNGKQFDRVKEYARHLAAGGERIGLIEVDASEFRLSCFEACNHNDHTCNCNFPQQQGETDSTETLSGSFDARQMRSALEELSCDIDRWLILLPNPRTIEARQVLQLTPEWALLSTCDHDGIISAYRTLKGLGDLHQASDRPALSLVLLDARQLEQCTAVYRKLAGVCDEFLHWPLTGQTIVRPTAHVVEHLVMCSRPMRSKSQSGTAPQWQVLKDFLAQPVKVRSPRQAMDSVEVELGKIMPEKAEPDRRPADAPVTAWDQESFEMRAVPTPTNLPKSMDMPAAPAPAPATPPNLPEVMDLSDLSPDAVVAAVLRNDPMGLLECPVRCPVCTEARLAVSRDRRLMLFAVARKGLADLRTIALAYRWLIENRALIGMAMPQLSIDAHQRPHLRLLVDHADITADSLTPLLETLSVTLVPYRKIRWGTKTGLLLEAA